MKIFKIFMNKQYKKAIAQAEKDTEKRVREEYNYQNMMIKEANKHKERLWKIDTEKRLNEKDREIIELKKVVRDIMDDLNKKMPKRITDYKRYLYQIRADIRFKQLKQEEENGEMEGIIDNAILSVEKLEKITDKSQVNANRKANSVL